MSTEQHEQQEHKVRWFARFPDSPADDWMPRQSSMRGAWGFDVRCSCGWETRTGGATESAIRTEVRFHKATS